MKCVEDDRNLPSLLHVAFISSALPYYWMDGRDHWKMNGRLDWWISHILPELPEFRKKILLKELSNGLWARHHTGFSTPNNKNLKFLLWYIQLRNLQQSLVNCTLQAEVSRKELMPFTSEWTIRRWDGWCMSAPPVGLWAPPVPFGHQWPPCRGWYPGSSQIHL